MTRKEILEALKSGQLGIQEATALLDEMERERQPLMRCKVAPKGGLSVYGINSRMPVTLYIEQWERLLEFGEQIQRYIAEWEGKQFKGKRKVDGKEVEYTAVLKRKAA